jgi:hypothetical protein
VWREEVQAEGEGGGCGECCQSFDEDIYRLVKFCVFWIELVTTALAHGYRKSFEYVKGKMKRSVRANSRSAH